jgi:hypothetical protein
VTLGKTRHSEIEQLVARQAHNLKVDGSNPSLATIALLVTKQAACLDEGSSPSGSTIVTEKWARPVLTAR